ncbi:MAG: ATP-binding cassette domain-containing protein [Planctomycetaceae bacterium]|jgi:molybdate transport system ATP-binding protein|nr:ATP-binding cassette domain-containing protein [Planctomycetaceae bacterium]
MTIEANITKKCNNWTLSLQFCGGSERLGILGASGCGKSMTLRCIAGIVKPDIGYIRINGHTVFDSERKINLPPQKRHAGLLFQNYALFPNMTVKENLLAVARKDTSAVDAMLEKLHLTSLADCKPAKLSGGEQQRTAIGRMLLSSPEIIMLDEPLSALDSYLHSAVETELMQILTEFQQEKRGSVIFVSHNRDEIYRICERIIVLQDGKKVADGTTGELFRRPETIAAARLTGVKNIAPAVIAGKNRLRIPSWGIELETAQELVGNETHVGVRAYHIRDALPDEERNCFCCKVERTQSEPFRIQEHLFPVTATCMEINNKKSLPLIRFVPNTTGPQVIGYLNEEIRRFHIPPDCVMPLTECR